MLRPTTFGEMFRFGQLANCPQLLMEPARAIAEVTDQRDSLEGKDRPVTRELIVDLSFLDQPDVTPCGAYSALFRLREQDAKRWAAAAYGEGLTAAIALVAAIVLFIVGQNGGGIASGVATVVTGGATRWLWKRRTEVQQEAADFLAKVKEYCPGAVPMG